MAYHTPVYLFLFLPLAVLCYTLCPQKHRWKVLLLFSYLFFYSISRKLLVYLLGATVLIHYIGIWLEALQTECKAKVKGLEREEKKALKERYNKKERGILLLGIVILVGCLAYLKYYNFFGASLNQFFRKKESEFISHRRVSLCHWEFPFIPCRQWDI